ncbi:MAG: ROK family protein [Clostridia bacterium]|nr:ROK family protein [Clostridia bacterium]
MILCIDIGGTAVKLGLLDREGQIHARLEVPTSQGRLPNPTLDAALQGAEKLVAEEKPRLEGVAVSAAGQIDSSRGVVAGSNGKLPGYEGSRIKETFEALYHVTTHVLNDANAAALGECFLGAGRGCRDVLMVTLGTGVGGGLVLGGKLYGGSRGLAGELGHFTLYQDGVPCSCGKRGCYESYAATTALVRRAGVENGRVLFDRVRAGDAEMKKALDGWLDDVAAGLTGLVHIFNPELVLVGGGVSAQEELLIKPLRQKVRGGVMPRFGERLRVERATLGNDAGMIGALRWWLDQEEDHGG